MLGCRLLERGSGGVSLTARAEQLRKLTERHVLALAAETLGRTSVPQLVRLSVIPTLAIQWLMQSRCLKPLF